MFSALEHLGDLEGDLEGLLVVEARVDEGLVVLGQAGLVDVLASAEDLGDVVAGELDVDAAPGAVPRARWTSKKPRISSRIVSKRRVL